MRSLFSRFHHHLDPGDSLGELIFGLIMVLTFTLGTASSKVARWWTAAH
jgi:hypothetical protein